jgi:glycosyltransferase involved in cell wall biosynthesis
MKIVIISSYTQSLVNFRGDMIKEMVKAGHEVIGVGSEGGFKDEIASLGARFIQLSNDRRSMNPINDLKFLKKLYTLLTTEKPDIVFSYTIKPVIYGSIAARFAKIPMIYAMITGLGQVYACSGKRAAIIKKATSILYWIAISCCNRVFFQNRDDIDEFCRNGITGNEKCVLINGSGVNLQKFSTSPLPGNPVFLMMARLIKAKGVIDYCQAAELVKRKFPHAHFLLLGKIEEGRDAVSLKELEPFIATGAIEYLGHLKDVRPTLSECSIFVLPSAYREGVPRSILEAMATGRPIITTDTPGCRETVENGINGFIVPAKDIRALTEKMEWMAKNYNEVYKMGQESLTICRNKFDVKIINKEILSVMNLNNV